MVLHYGLVAQLGAHHIRIVGVEGSNPFKSTTEKSTCFRKCFFQTVEKACFFEDVGAIIDRPPKNAVFRIFRRKIAWFSPSAMNFAKAKFTGDQ